MFTLESSFEADVSAWTKLIQVNPDECRNLGEPLNNKKKTPSRTAFWSLKSDMELTDNVRLQLRSLIAPLLRRSDEIRALIVNEQIEVGVAIFVWMQDEEEVDDLDLYLESSDISDLSKLGADFTFRIYDYLKD